MTDLRRQCGPRVALVLSSPKYDPTALSREMREAFPRICVAGCTTAGEIVCGKMPSGSVVAMFLHDNIMEDAASTVVEKLSSGISLVLIDGLSGAEERLMEKLGDRADLVFVGGSAVRTCSTIARHSPILRYCWY